MSDAWVPKGYTPVTTQHAGTQSAINGLLDQMGLAPVQGRMPRVEPLAAIPRRLEPLQAVRIPKADRPIIPTRIPTGGGAGVSAPMMPTAMGNPSQALVHIPGLGSSGPSQYVDDLAAAATGAGGKMASAKGLLGGIGSKVNGMPFPKGTAGRVGLGMALGLASGPVSNALGGNDSFLGRFSGGALSGAGLGAIGGPWAALGGGLAMGLYQGFFGDDDNSGGFDKDKIVNYMNTTGMGEDQQNEMFALYELEKDALGEDQAKASLMQRLSVHAEMMDTQEFAAAQEAVAQQRMLASQALAGQFFQPFAQQMITSAQQRHQMMQNVLPTLPENFRGIAAAQSATALDNATRMATAYQAQAQMIPAMASFQEQQGQVNNLASQLLQQGIQNALTPQSSGSLQELLAGAGQ